MYGLLAIVFVIVGGSMQFFAGLKNEESAEKHAYRGWIIAGFITTLVGGLISGVDSYKSGKKQDADSEEIKRLNELTLEYSRDNKTISEKNVALAQDLLSLQDAIHTGGDSKCYLRFSDGKKPTVEFAIYGDYDIPRVDVEVYDVTDYKEGDDAYYPPIKQLGVHGPIRRGERKFLTGFPLPKGKVGKYIVHISRDFHYERRYDLDREIDCVEPVEITKGRDGKYTIEYNPYFYVKEQRYWDLISDTSGVVEDFFYYQGSDKFVASPEKWPSMLRFETEPQGPEEPFESVDGEAPAIGD